MPITIVLLLTAPLWGQSTAPEPRVVPPDVATYPGVTTLMLRAAELSGSRLLAFVRTQEPQELQAAAQDGNGNTALHWAAFYATDPEVIDVLLDAGVPIDVVNNQGLTAFEILQGNSFLLGSAPYQRLLGAKIERRRAERAGEAR